MRLTLSPKGDSPRRESLWTRDDLAVRL